MRVLIVALWQPCDGTAEDMVQREEVEAMGYVVALNIRALL